MQIVRARRAAAAIAAALALGVLTCGVSSALADTPPVTGGLPAQAPLAALGRRMFFDPGLSASGKLACSTCHDPKYAYGPPPGKAIALGGPRGDRQGTRAVPSLRYLQQIPAFQEVYHFLDGDVGPGGGLTWDGRAASTQEQARLPLLAANEMANASPAEVVARVARSAYAGDFQNQFGADIFQRPDDAFTSILAALAAFQRTPEEFFPYSSKYDAYLRDETDLTDAEVRGVALFKDPAKGNCASCHVSSIRNGVHPDFTDFDYINIGAPRNPAIRANARPGWFDGGLYGPNTTALSGNKLYCGYFRSPTLRNAMLRDAFFHNGVLHSMRQVVEFYLDRDIHPERWYPRRPGGKVKQYDDLPTGCPDNVDHDPPMDRKPGDQPALNTTEVDDLLAFLNTLTDGWQPPKGSAP